MCMREHVCKLAYWPGIFMLISIQSQLVRNVNGEFMSRYVTRFPMSQRSFLWGKPDVRDEMNSCF